MPDDEEVPLSVPFWLIDNLTESDIIERVLRRRFSETMDRLAEGLEQADPMDIVYSGNPNEYADVVREIVVLLAGVDGDLSQVTSDRLREFLREGLARRFGETAEPTRISEAVRIIQREPQYGSYERRNGSTSG